MWNLRAYNKPVIKKNKATPEKSSPAYHNIFLFVSIAMAEIAMAI